MLGLGRHLLYSTRDYHDEGTWWYFLIPVSYTFGIFPTAQLVAGLLGHDPTEEGSGNPGASNVYRVAGAKAGILVLAGDLMKGFIPMKKMPFWRKSPAMAVACGMTLSAR